MGIGSTPAASYHHWYCLARCFNCDPHDECIDRVLDGTRVACRGDGGDGVQLWAHELTVRRWGGGGAGGGRIKSPPDLPYIQEQQISHKD